MLYGRGALGLGRCSAACRSKVVGLTSNERVTGGESTGGSCYNTWGRLVTRLGESIASVGLSGCLAERSIHSNFNLVVLRDEGPQTCSADEGARRSLVVTQALY